MISSEGSEIKELLMTKSESEEESLRACEESPKTS